MTSATHTIIQASLTADVPLLLWGPPGTGKTAHLRSLANEAGAHVETLIGSQLDPTDVGGLPIPHGGLVALAPPAWALRARAALVEGRPVWLFFDEISCAAPSVQAALLRVVHERQVADVDLRGCRVVAAANPADTAADGGTLAAATANRWAHVDWRTDPVEWAAGEAAGWGRPGRTHDQHRASALVAEYIRRNPKTLIAVPESLEAQSRAWPSPRTWSHAAALLAAHDSRESVAACVGAAAASEFFAWRDALDLPDPADLLAGRANLPERGDSASAALSALVAHVRGLGADEASIRAAWRVIGAARPDTAITAARALLELAPAVAPPEAVALGTRISAAGRRSA